MSQSASCDWLRSVLPSNMRLEGLCGSGGMGTVFRVYHKDWAIHLAIKVPHHFDKSRAVADFLKEADLWSGIGLHPYVATLFYVRELGSKPCTVSEFVEGGGMDSLLRVEAHRGIDEQTSLSRILSLASATAWGLDAAHQNGLVHCDFKPANALVSSEFTAKVTDFGLARRAQIGGVATPGSTVIYQSPEQSRRENLTSATDFWSWAATCFEMFTGSITWSTGAAAGVAFDEFVQQGAKFPGYPRIPAQMIDILQACFVNRPQQRPKSFHKLALSINQLHEEIFDEACAAIAPDTELVAADSLNNRGVSLLDLGDPNGASALFEEALRTDPLHPEAIFNLFVVGSKHRSDLARTESALRESGNADPYNATALLLLARLLKAYGQEIRAKECLVKAFERSGSSDDVAKSELLKPALAKPMSGEDVAYHRERFNRLFGKAKAAWAQGDWREASRYSVMASDIPGFARHPELTTLKRNVNGARNELLGN